MSSLTTLAVASALLASCRTDRSAPTAEPPGSAILAPAPPDTAPPGAAILAPAPVEVSIGTYHRVGVADAINLDLRSDGSFELKLFGCDYGSRSDGRWVQTADGVQLLPAAGQTDLDWLRHNFVHAVPSVRLKKTSPTELVGSDDGSRETWRAGRICAICGPPGPPPSQLVPCEARR